MAIGNFFVNAGQLGLRGNEPLRHVAVRRRLRRDGATCKRDGGQNGENECHASPPARSASGDLTRDTGLRPSIALYHDTRLAAAIMTIMPNTLIPVCSSGPPDDSAMTNWPAKARNTPRQKTSNECWRQTKAGQRRGD